MAASILPSFDVAPPPSAEDEAYARGLADGRAAATEEHAAQQDRLSAELVQNIKDIEFKFAEARADITQAIGPVFGAICDKLFPAIVDQVYVFRIADMLRDAALAQTPDQMTLVVHPDQLCVVRAAAQELSPQVSVHADPGLSLHAVILKNTDGQRLFDPESLINSVSALMETIVHPSERRQTDGSA